MDTIENHNIRQQQNNNINMANNNNLRKMWCHMCKYEFETMNQNTFECVKCKNDFCEEIQPSIESIDDPRSFVPYGEENNQNNNSQQQQQPSNVNHNQSQNSPIRNINQLRHNHISNANNISNIINNNNSHQPRLSYSISIQSNQLQNQNNMMGINSLISNLFPVTAQRTGLMGGMSDNNFDNIIDFIMRNDQNVYGTPPAGENIINSLPRVEFSKAIKEQSQSEECSVCKDEFNDGESLIKMPCNHLFHQPCLIKWLKMHNSCPTCRHELPTDNPDYERRKQERLERNQQNNNNSQRRN